jgi:hypothetical protein
VPAGEEIPTPEPLERVTRAVQAAELTDGPRAIETPERDAA